MKRLLLIGNGKIKSDISKEVQKFDFVVRLNGMDNYNLSKSRTNLFLCDNFSKSILKNINTKLKNIDKIICFNHYSNNEKLLSFEGIYKKTVFVDFNQFFIKKYINNYDFNACKLSDFAWVILYCLEYYGEEYDLYIAGSNICDECWLKKRNTPNDENSLLQQLINEGKIKIFSRPYNIHYSNPHNLNPDDKDGFNTDKFYTRLRDKSFCEEDLKDVKMEYNYEFKQTNVYKFPQISSFWHSKGRILPDIVVASINSFVNAGYKYNLFTYKKYKNIPRGVVVKDANEIVPFSDMFEKGNFALFVDYFRIFLVNKYDTAWSDADNIFISDDFETQMVLIIQYGRVQNGFFYLDNSEKGNLFKKCLLDFVTHPKKIQPFDSIRTKNEKERTKNLATSMEIIQSFDWNVLGSELYTSINNYIDANRYCYDYSKYFCGFHFTNQYKLYVLPEKPYMHYYNKDVKILTLSYNLLYREPWIVKNYITSSYFANLYSNINGKKPKKTPVVHTPVHDFAVIVFQKIKFTIKCFIKYKK